MQLLILLALLLSGGDADNLLKQILPILKETDGGDLQNNLKDGDIQSILKRAEEFSGIISALQSMGGMPAQKCAKAEDIGKNGGFVLAPIAGVADENVISRMAKYIADDD